MKRKWSILLVIAVLLGLFSGTALAAPNVGGGSAQPEKPQTGYPQYSDEYYDLYGGASNNSTITLEIMSDMGLRVVVTETDGVTPIEGATVNIVTVKSGDLLAGLTDETGTAFIELPRPGIDPDNPDGVLKKEVYEFTVEKDGYMPSEKITVEFDGHTQEKHVMLERAAREVTIKVIDPDKNPVEGAGVELNHYVTGEQTGSGVTDADGTIKTTLPIAVHKIVVSHKDYALYSGLVNCKPETENVTIQLAYNRYNVRLFIRNQETGEPVPQARIIITDLMQTYASGEDGKVAIAGGMPPGTYRYSVTVAGYKRNNGTFTVVESGEVQEIVIDMEPTAKNIAPPIVESLTPPGGGSAGTGAGAENGGQEFLETPQPLSLSRSVDKKIDVESCVHDKDGNELEGVSLTFLPEDLKLTSDENGRAVFHEAAIGEHTINAEKDGKHASVDFEIVTGSEFDVIMGEKLPRVIVTEDMDTVTLFFELDGNELRFAGLTKESQQDATLKSDVVPAPYAENIALTDGDTASMANAPQPGENMLWWLLALLFAVLAGCIVATYVHREKDEEENAKI